MNKEYIEQHEIAHRYLAGSLCAEEIEQFEVYLMEHPQMLEELELNSIIKTHASAYKPKITSTSKWRSLFTQPLYVSFSTAVVSLFCFAMFLTIADIHFSPTSTNHAKTSLIYLETQRSSSPLGSATDINIKEANELLVFSMSVSAEPNQQFDVFIKSSNGSMVATLNGSGNEYGDLVVSIVSDQLATGSYEVTAIAKGQTEAAFSSTIRVKR